MLGDSAYGTGEFRDHLERTAKTAVIKPPPLRPAVPGGFDLDDFEIDDEDGHARPARPAWSCPHRQGPGQLRGQLREPARCADAARRRRTVG